jgi:hypothetical protein
LQDRQRPRATHLRLALRIDMGDLGRAQFMHWKASTP